MNSKVRTTAIMLFIFQLMSNKKTLTVNQNPHKFKEPEYLKWLLMPVVVEIHKHYTEKTSCIMNIFTYFDDNI